MARIHIAARQHHHIKLPSWTSCLSSSDLAEIHDEDLDCVILTGAAPPLVAIQFIRPSLLSLAQLLAPRASRCAVRCPGLVRFAPRVALYPRQVPPTTIATYTYCADTTLLYVVLIVAVCRCGIGALKVPGA